LYDSLFVNNDASGPSNTTTLIYNSVGSTESSVMNAMNNTWVGNPDTAVYYTINSNGAFYNNILWGNGTASQITPYATAACNDTQGSLLAGSGNISQDPLFYTSARGNYRLSSGSPAIDACASGTTPDLDNYARPFGDDYDMGAFESHWYFNFLPLIVHD
jgi:hypothetical protein